MVLRKTRSVDCKYVLRKRLGRLTYSSNFGKGKVASYSTDFREYFKRKKRSNFFSEPDSPLRWRGRNNFRDMLAFLNFNNSCGSTNITYNVCFLGYNFRKNAMVIVLNAKINFLIVKKTHNEYTF